MQTLWSNEKPQPLKKQMNTIAPLTAIAYIPIDCTIFGINWQTIGMSDEMQCARCAMKDYYQGCIQNAPEDAHQYYDSTFLLPKECLV